MGERTDEQTRVVRAHTLEPIAGRIRIGQPACYRIRRVVDPAPKPKSRLLFLPPVWTRTSFWLPLGRFAVVSQPCESPSTDPHDDFAA